jgi:translation initiation factor IF-2
MTNDMGDRGKMNATKSKKSDKSDKIKATIPITEGVSVKKFAEDMGVRARDLIELLSRHGLDVTAADFMNAPIIHVIEKALSVKIVMKTIEEKAKACALENKENLQEKPMVVTIMGHVDHGKTTLLDAIRQSNIVDGEFGGITQHIGAYRITSKGRKITFVDTPGHEAFTQLRSRGAKVTDIVVLVVAADDGVMPQTREAINHAKAAEVPIIVAINKIDKAEADLDKTKQQLSKEGLLVEDWGGDTVSVEISAKEKKNLDDLLEMIGLVSEMQELKANPLCPAQGVVLEARLDAKKGPLATVIIQQGTLKPNDAFITGTNWGKVKAMFDENGQMIKEATLSVPVEILGFAEVPTSGDIFQVVDDVEKAKKIAQMRQSQAKKPETAGPSRLTLDQLFKKIEEGETKDLSLVIKADVQGSVEVLNDLLPNLSTEQVKIDIIHSATGAVSESDVMLASASRAIIIAYNTRVAQKIRDLAKEESVEIRTYNVIYNLTDDLKKAMTGLLEPVFEEAYLGRAEVRRIFRIPRVGAIAGCYVTDGRILRKAMVRVVRDGEVIHKGKISSLKHLKENVTEIKKEYECGIGIDKFNDIQEGDFIEAFIIEQKSP